MWEENNEAEDPEKYDADLAGDIISFLCHHDSDIIKISESWKRKYSRKRPISAAVWMSQEKNI